MPLSVLLMAIGAMAIATFCLRITPFLLSEHSPLLRLFNGDNNAINALGPVLLGVLAVISLVPALTAASLPHDGAYIGGSIATIVVLAKTHNTGFAIIAGVAAYGLMLQWAG